MSSRLGLQMPIQTTDLHNPEASSDRESISHLPHRSGPGIYGNTLPSIQDTRYNNSTNYDHTPSPASTTSLYSHYSYQPSGYQPSASPYSPTVPNLVSPYGMTPDSSRPRIPSMHSPVSHHPENPTSSSVSSARSAYATATPHTARHHHRSPRIVHAPHAPQSPQPRNMSSPPATTESPSLLDTPPPQSGPPMGNTQILCNLYSADSVLVEPEIHGRVDKGFFLADRDWTCYRRNYFTVICSYSLKPSTHSLPFYLKRTATSQPENVLAFAMCISAVVDAPGGKVVELVQHTPKRDKGPQQKPSMVKLAPQPIGGLGLYTSNAQAPQTPQGNDFNSFPQQTQQQSIAAFERIQFKSATANNGKRRAAQQYYHLIIELFADVGTPNSSGSSHNSSESGWVKIAYKTSAPMVVRGRSPGHYADERRVQSPGGNNGSGNGNTNNTQSPRSGGEGQGMMGGSDIGSSSDVLGPSRLNISNMNGYHHMGTIHSAHTSPSPSSIRDPSIATPPPPAHLDGPPIDPVITGDDGTPFYQYFPGTIYSGPHSSPIYGDAYSDERRSEGPVVTHCAQFDNDISSYIPSSLREPRVPYRKCGPYGDSTDGSRGYFPDLPAV